MNERKKKVNRLAFLGSLAGGLAHEIKNPLSTISVNLQLMQEDWSDSEGPRERRTLKRIQVLTKEIERLEEILNDFLAYARGFSLQPTSGNVNQMVNDLATFLEPEAHRLGIEIRLFLDPALPRIPIDVKYLKLALINLIQNALQAFEGWDGIREVLVRTRTLPGGVEIVITDTGPGIAEEHRDRVFHVYFSTKRTGTGLGLPMVKRIVGEHDGTVSFQSEEGKGTSFTIFLPLGAAEPGKSGEENR
jgi:signal transduction histidine kinase